MTSLKHEPALRTPKTHSPPIPHPFGSLAPWAEPTWYSSLQSPYYGPSHRSLRAAMRSYVDTHILPHHLDWEAAGGAPRDEALRFAQSGLAFGDVPLKYRPRGFEKVGGVPYEELDPFHALVMMDEMSRFEGGVGNSLTGGSGIGVPPIVYYGSEAQKRKWLPGLFDWSTSVCLGITEPSGGSDVGAIKTRAVKDPAGKMYVVNGTKKWITGAPWATHMTTAVRTGGAGMKGVSLLVIPLKDTPGVTVKRIENSGQKAGGASWVFLEDVRVPVENLLGEENQGFPMIMTNFNKERYMLAVMCNRKARTCLSVALQYAADRETFGQPLLSHQIIRHKLADIAREVECHWAWLEQLAYHVKVSEQGWQSPDLAGKIALCKVQGGLIIEKAAREAQQVLGGVGYQKGGVGGQVEQITRDLRMYVVGGGSEEILKDLAFRQEMLNMGKKGGKL